MHRDVTPSSRPAQPSANLRNVLPAAAVHYAEIGWPLLLLRPLGKLPLKRGWRDNPIRTPDEAQRLWKEEVWAGIALHTGSASGIVVIDIDPRHGGSVDVLEAKFGALPATIESVTPSGGSHLFFRCALAVPNSCGRVARGIDVRGDGGLAVLPPSRVRRDDGSIGHYSWCPGHAPGEIELAALPEALYRAALPPPAPPMSHKPLVGPVKVDGILAVIARADVGRRNAATYWAAARLGELVRRGKLRYAQAIALVVTAARHRGLNDKEALATALSGIRCGMGG
jgi:putative DNA primase/helicase